MLSIQHATRTGISTVTRSYGLSSYLRCISSSSSSSSSSLAADAVSLKDQYNNLSERTVPSMIQHKHIITNNTNDNNDLFVASLIKGVIKNGNSNHNYYGLPFLKYGTTATAPAKTITSSSLDKNVLPSLSSQHQHSATPITIGWFNNNNNTTTTIRYDAGCSVNEQQQQQQQQVPITNDAINSTTIVLELLNRNARRGKRANHGKRPVSRQARRKKRRAFGNHRR